MTLKLVVLFCVLQLIAGAKIPNREIEPRSISPRIIGGFDAAEGQAPFQCSVQNNQTRLKHFCGCAIVSAEYAITAAHCLQGEDVTNITILAGTNKLSSGGSHYDAEKLIIHEDYNNPPRANDIGLIRLKTPIEFNEKLQPIKISPKKIRSGVKLQVFGWGRMNRRGQIPDNLQVLNVTSISNDACDEYVNADSSHLCTMSKFRTGACYGDSGGPLVYNNELVGIFNWMTPSCARGNPDGFARMSYLYEWIEKNMNSH